MTIKDAAEADCHVLFVDDDELTSLSDLRAAFQTKDVSVRLRHPENVLPTDLSWADLVVVDYFLNNWPERDAVDSIARAPRDGLAVAATLRSTLLPSLEERGYPGALPTRAVAFALWSGHLAAASFGLPDVVLPHVFSRENNLEWAFRRDSLFTTDGASQVANLAHAVRALPEGWGAGPGAAETSLRKLLGLDSSTVWAPDAMTDVLNCRPPLHELSERSHGLVILRWLLHRIVPYPCFLLDEKQLSCRLRVDDLGQGDLINELGPYEYSGLLAQFSGRRWWRAGIDDWLFQRTNGNAGDPVAVAELALSLGAQRQRQWLRPVIVIEADLSRSAELCEVEDAVRVRPDDWPPFADDAFARLTDAASDTRLSELVVPTDRALVSDTRGDVAKWV